MRLDFKLLPRYNSYDFWKKGLEEMKKTYVTGMPDNTSADTDPQLCAKERKSVFARLGMGSWSVFGSHGFTPTMPIDERGTVGVYFNRLNCVSLLCRLTKCGKCKL